MFIRYLFPFCTIFTRVTLASDVRVCNEDERIAHPILCNMVYRLIDDPRSMSLDIYHWAKRHNLLVGGDLVNEIPTVVKKRHLRDVSISGSNVPVVIAHGMGDSCFNSGIKSITRHISELLNNTYATCIPTGDTREKDTNNGFFLSMDASVEIFAGKVQADPALADGFQAMGFSQGNNVIRGYIAKFNDPPVKTFISVNGVNAGTAAVPYCIPSSSAKDNIDISFPSVCDLLMEQASRAAYTTYAQKHSFQANYWRDPRKKEFPTYQKHCQLAQWNNEGLTGVNETLRTNWSKTDRFVWILAEEDEMVWPKEGEQWGAPDPENPFRGILAREETAWFKENLFGLRTAEEAGKNIYTSFEGDHLQFSRDDLDEWVQKYFH